MKNLSRYFVSTLILAIGLILIWGGYSQAAPDSYYLYSAGILFTINSIGLFYNKLWVKKSWKIIILAAVIYAIYYDTLPLRHDYYGPFSPSLLLMLFFGLIPLIATSIIAYFLPKLISNKK